MRPNNYYHDNTTRSEPADSNSFSNGQTNSRRSSKISDNIIGSSIKSALLNRVLPYDLNPSECSHDQRTLSCLQSDGSSFKPSSSSSLSSSQHVELNTSQEQPDIDGESDGHSIRQFLRNENSTWNNFRRTLNRLPERRTVRQHLQRENNFGIKQIIFLLGVLAFISGGFLLDGDEVVGTHQQNQNTTQASSCWNLFKQQNCDIEKPTGYICKELYECVKKNNISKQRQIYYSPSRDEEMNSESNRGEETHIGQGIFALLFAGSLLIIVCKFFGTSELSQIAEIATRGVMRIAANAYWEYRRSRA